MKNIIKKRIFTFAGLFTATSMAFAALDQFELPQTDKTLSDVAEDVGNLAGEGGTLVIKIALVVGLILVGVALYGFTKEKNQQSGNGRNMVLLICGGALVTLGGIAAIMSGFFN